MCSTFPPCLSSMICANHQASSKQIIRQGGKVLHMLVPKCIHMAVGPYFGFLLHHVLIFEEEGVVNHKIPRQKNKSSSMEWMTHNNGRSEGRAELCWAT